MKTTMRTDYCGVFRSEHTGRFVSVCGWVGRRRDLGGLLFTDLRDRTGILQLAFDENTAPEVFETALSCRAEYVIRAEGKIRERSAKNPDIPTGDVELEVTSLEILAQSETPPFAVESSDKVNDSLRLKYRYLDLRRPELQSAVAMRHKVAKVCREYFDELGFLEIETPMLTKSTPEGARDYLVPSRVKPGEFYALPQSPQQYKQLLMLAGFDRYMQITRCFRDEDLRADRQPEFTQIDLEMSFVTQDDIIEIQEGFIKRVFKEVLNVDVKTPFLRLTLREAMSRFGSDKPDLRFGCEIRDISDIVKNCGFRVFSEPVAAGGSVRLINVKGGASVFTRKQIDALVEFVKTYRAKGLAWSALGAENVTSSYRKFLSDTENAAVSERAGAEQGDLILIVGDANNDIVLTALGALRRECAAITGLIKPDIYEFLFVTDFPLFEFSEEENRFVAMHHPFTAPADEDRDLLDTDKAACRAKAYDLVLNGTELGGGSVRINDPCMQMKMFEALGFAKDEAEERFGHLINALKYGAPPHGGFAYGLDRLVMLMAQAESIRDVTAFPKVQNASEPMTGCPGSVDEKQLAELGIRIIR
ncbi:MAG: aspartate--tRNA ligase [Oscillospiraceae bacterium]|nr:aspartate--tRNA ligase [Oscillospiraceae bacterium]